MFPSTNTRTTPDCAGHPLRAGDYVSPIDHPGDHREAPVYRVHRVCTDGETIHLTREDGSTLYRPASVLLYLPETTAARHAAATARQRPDEAQSQPATTLADLCRQAERFLIPAGSTCTLHSAALRETAVGTITGHELTLQPGLAIIRHHVQLASYIPREFGPAVLLESSPSGLTLGGYLLSWHNGRQGTIQSHITPVTRNS